MGEEKKQVNWSINAELVVKFKTRAIEKKISYSEYIEQLIRKEVDNQ